MDAIPSRLGDVPLELNPALDAGALAREFAVHGRIHIPDILTVKAASRLLQALYRETPWGLIFNEGERVRELGAVPPQEYEKLLGAAIERARSSHQYFFHHHRILNNGIVHPAPGHYLRAMAGFLTSRPMLDFARLVTGQAGIAGASATATLYQPLNFLTIHDDNDSDAPGGGRRLVAYVLNMTPVWHPDWGGALQFFDRRDHIEESYLPAFNALNMFLVPKFHSVGQVAAFAGSRFSVSGWFESDTPLLRPKMEL